MTAMKPTEKGFFDREICQPVHLRGDDNGILLLHGFTGSAAHMRKLADALHQRGHTVRTINLPGHASTEEDMARSNWQMWLQATWPAPTGKCGCKPPSKPRWICSRRCAR